MASNIEAFNLEQDMGAAAAAEWLGIGNALFKDLQPDDCFRFHTSPEVMTKARRGYVDRLGNRWSTGARTAVFRVAKARG